MKVKPNEVLFLSFVAQGRIDVSSDGIVTNLTTGNKLGYEQNNGYLRVSLGYEGKVIQILLHRLVYIVCVGEIPNEMTVNHVDGDKKNNAVSNLELCTFDDNMKHAYANGLIDLKARAMKVKEGNAYRYL